jgi:hypothetical protein
MSLLINVDSTTKQVRPANGDRFTLDEVYDLIGCRMVQEVYTRDGKAMLIDEEGKLNGKPVNQLATYAYQWGGDDDIVGTALIVEGEWG